MASRQEAPPAPPPAPSAAPRPAPTNVTATPSSPLEFNITASSDLPPAGVSTNRPYTEIVDAALAPVRPALAECLRALGAPARRSVRVTLDPGGEVRPRPPQNFVLSPHDARCMEGVLRAVTLDPPPPREMPYDLAVEVGP